MTSSSAPSPAPRNRPRSNRAATILALTLLAILTGCQPLSPIIPAAQVRVINASPNAPLLDVYQGSAPLTYNLGFGNITSYIATSPGPSDLAVNLSGGSRQLFTAMHAALNPAAQYTFLLSGTSGTLQPLLLKDQSTPAPPGQAALRFLDQVNAGGGLDIFLVPSGASPRPSLPSSSTRPLEPTPVTSTSPPAPTASSSHRPPPHPSTHSTLAQHAPIPPAASEPSFSSTRRAPPSPPSKPSPPPTSTLPLPATDPGPSSGKPRRPTPKLRESCSLKQKDTFAFTRNTGETPVSRLP